MHFSGVREVRVARSMHSYMDTANIRVPRMARLKKGALQADGSVKPKPGAGVDVATASLIKDGDKVTIKLGYNGQMQTEFEGFVKRRNIGMPLDIECEGYARQLRTQVSVAGFIKETTTKKFLEIACGIRDAKGALLAKPTTDVTVICDADMPMSNIRMLEGTNGLQIIDEIKRISQNTLSIFFIEPKVMWCGFTYTAYRQKVDPFNTGEAKYRLGYNCIKDNGLKERVVTDPVQVIFSGTSVAGHKVMTASEAKSAKSKAKTVFNNVGDLNWLHKLANEKQYKLNYAGYEGTITGFLQPYCAPSYKAVIVDKEFEERNGTYLVESTTVTFGLNGARRAVELGPLIGFDPNKITQL